MIMNLDQLMKDRYSCRKFSDEPVDDRDIKAICEAANLAPTAVNNQPFKIFVAKSDEAKKAIRANTAYHFNAPVLLVVGAEPQKGWVRPFDSKNFAEVDASIAVTHMLLKIQELGLGTTWVGHFDAPGLKKIYPEMADLELICVLPIGHRGCDAKPSSSHSKRKDLDELIVEL